MVRKMRWACLVALLPAIAAAQAQLTPFDFGGGARTDKPWSYLGFQAQSQDARQVGLSQRES